MSENKKLTKNIALCGVLAGLAIGMMYLGEFTPLDLSLLLICSLITILTVIETGNKMACIYAAVTSVLALVILPNKLYAIEYIVFSAIYPIVKGYAERLPKWPAFVVKIAVLDIMLLFCILLGQYVFALGEEFYSLGVLTMVIGTLFFMLYDYTLTKCITYYIVILRKKLKIK